MFVIELICTYFLPGTWFGHLLWTTNHPQDMAFVLSKQRSNGFQVYVDIIGLQLFYVYLFCVVAHASAGLFIIVDIILPA